MTDVCKQTIEGWALQLKQQGLRLNTMSCYMRSLRSIIAHSDMCLHAEDLFKGVFTGNEHTRKRSISAEMLCRIRELKIPPSSPMALVHDVFMFSVYALGMPFVDVAFLQKQQIRNGYIDYQRHKTGQRIHIKVEPVMQRIINRHIRNDTPYVFPILRHGTMLEYQKARGSYNHQLRKLGLLAGVCNLTSYVARHSWASMAYQQKRMLPVAEAGYRTMRFMEALQRWQTAQAMGEEAERCWGIYLADEVSFERANKERQEETPARPQPIRTPSTYMDLFAEENKTQEQPVVTYTPKTINVSGLKILGSIYIGGIAPLGKTRYKVVKDMQTQLVESGVYVNVDDHTDFITQSFNDKFFTPWRNFLQANTEALGGEFTTFFMQLPFKEEHIHSNLLTAPSTSKRY